MSKWRAASGYNSVFTLGLILVSLMMSAAAIDMGYYFSAQNQLQTAADAASLAATDQLYRSTATDSQERLDEAEQAARETAAENLGGADAVPADGVIFGFIDPTTKIYDPATFQTPTNDSNYDVTGGYNAVRVRTARNDETGAGPLSSIMGNLIGITNISAQASSIGLIDATVTSITDGGLRPIFVCQGQMDAAASDGNISNNTIRIYGDGYAVDGNTSVTNCPTLGSGNWGFADLRECQPGAPGNNTLSNWWANGYPGTVSTDSCVSTQPGNSINSNGVTSALEQLKTNGTVIKVPLIDSFSGSGSNTQVGLSAFAGFVITAYSAQGNNSWVEGHFVNSVCTEGCGTGGGTTHGGAVVKLRLAGKALEQ